MKKFLLISTLCALALVGCKDDSELEIPTKTIALFRIGIE